MSFIDTVMKFIVKKFWPWFKEFVWPYIKDHVKDLIFLVIEKMKDMFKQWVQEKSETRQKEAEQKAQEAEKEASDAPNIHEAEKYRAIAQVWREVAEQFREDNEDLKRKLEEFEKEAKFTSGIMVDNMELDVNFSKEKTVLIIGDKIRELPALPE